MKSYFILLITLLFSLSIYAEKPTEQQQEQYQLQRNELRFTENKGQVADLEGNLRPDILFTAQSNGVKLFLTKTGMARTKNTNNP